MYGRTGASLRFGPCGHQDLLEKASIARTKKVALRIERRIEGPKVGVIPKTCGLRRSSYPRFDRISRSGFPGMIGVTL